MTDSIIRCQYIGQFSDSANSANLKGILNQCELRIKKLIDNRQVMTAALYRHGSILFAYYECIGSKLQPEELFSELEPYLLKWPGREELRTWVQMYQVFYHCIPSGAEMWKRKTEPEKRKGRLAVIKSDKIFSYIYHHVAIVNEGLLKGDKYLSIALYENYLFMYTEEPKVVTCIRGETDEEPKAVQGWREAKPREHFEQWPDSTDTFTDLETLLVVHD